MAQLMPLPLIVSCSSKIQIGFTFLVPTHPASPGQSAFKRVCVCFVALTLLLRIQCIFFYHFVDNHASNLPLSFFTVRMPFLPPNQQRQSTEGNKK